jgi:hypothetical protein
MSDAEKPKCEWTRIDTDFNYWRSSCGEEWALDDGTPTENKMRFCHYCGKPLHENSQPDDLG